MCFKPVRGLAQAFCYKTERHREGNILVGGNGNPTCPAFSFARQRAPRGRKRKSGLHGICCLAAHHNKLGITKYIHFILNNFMGIFCCLYCSWLRQGSLATSLKCIHIKGKLLKDRYKLLALCMILQ
jgi:hypothetical protein